MEPLSVMLIVASVLGVVLVAGLLAGQFRRGVVQELRASLSTATHEIDIERTRGDRLEQEASMLRAEVAQLRQEVAVLRTVVVDERKIADGVARAVRDEDERRTTMAVEAVKAAIEASTEAVLNALQREEVQYGRDS